MRMLRAAMFLMGVGLVVGACGEDQERSGAAAEVGHVHGLGVNPGDGALFIATHSGLFRSAADSGSAEPVGPLQDTMGFTVISADRFLASGHRPPGEEASPHLGLIASDDAGSTWETVSLEGAADLHVLRASGRSVWAYDALRGHLLVSADGGRTWSRSRPPEPIFDLVVDPGTPRRLIATTEAGLIESRDAGRSWSSVARKVGFLSWPRPDDLYLLDGTGSALASEDVGRTWRRRGTIGGLPVAFTSSSDGTLYAARDDGTVVRSNDGGASWVLRYEP